MSALRTAISQHLRTFVEPQIEQLSLRMESVRCGLYATLPKSHGKGFSGRRRSARSASSVCT